MSRALARAPDLVEPVIGYRQWRAIATTLWSPFVAHRWVPGVNTAHCERAGHPDPAPGHDCQCGLHAWYRPCPRLGYAAPDLVGGAVALWGEVELHPTGLRAQYAAIIALVLPLSRASKRRRVMAIADALGVDIVPARQLTSAALDHGVPISTGMAPRAA